MHALTFNLCYVSDMGTLKIDSMEWLTLEWLMRNLEWAVGLLLVGCILLFFFPILLGLQLKQGKDSENES